MNSVNVVKGYPVSVRFGVTLSDVPVAINDGSWTLSAELHYQTRKGPEPFPLTLVPDGNSAIVTITSTQTNTLDHRGSGYVLLFFATKNDETVFLKDERQVNVRDGL